MNSRTLIGFIYLVLFIIGVLVSIFWWCDIVFYSDSKTDDLFKIWGRIFFVFIFTLLGISFRAFKWSKIGTVSPWGPYFGEYPLISFIATLIIFSGVGLVVENSFGYFFYTLTAPLAIVAGFGGYKTFESLMGKTN